jgi:hypothetical protein
MTIRPLDKDMNTGIQGQQSGSISKLDFINYESAFFNNNDDLIMTPL